MIVLVKKDSEFGDTIAILNINGNTLIKHVKEQIEAISGIHKTTQCLLHRFHNGSVEKPWLLNGNGKISSYLIKDGSTLVLRRKRKGGNDKFAVLDQRHRTSMRVAATKQRRATAKQRRVAAFAALALRTLTHA